MRVLIAALLVSAFICSLACSHAGGQTAGQPGKEAASQPSVAFDTYSGYFVSNKFEPNEAASFVVIRDQAEFDRVFGVAMVMRDKSHRLPPNAFDSKIVLAVVKRGKAVWDYSVKDVRLDGRTLIVRYTATAKPQASAEFACPLILSVDKGDYGAVQFVENDKEVKKVDMAKAASQPAGR